MESIVSQSPSNPHFLDCFPSKGPSTLIGMKIQTLACARIVLLREYSLALSIFGHLVDTRRATYSNCYSRFRSPALLRFAVLVLQAG